MTSNLSAFGTTINHRHVRIFIKVRYIFFSLHNTVRVGYDVSMLYYSYLWSPRAELHVNSWPEKKLEKQK